MKTEFRQLSDGRWYWRVLTTVGPARGAANTHGTRREAREAYRAGKAWVRR